MVVVRFIVYFNFISFLAFETQTLSCCISNIVTVGQDNKTKESSILIMSFFPCVISFLYLPILSQYLKPYQAFPPKTPALCP